MIDKYKLTFVVPCSFHACCYILKCKSNFKLDNNKILIVDLWAFCYFFKSGNCRIIYFN